MDGFGPLLGHGRGSVVAVRIVVAVRRAVVVRRRVVVVRRVVDVVVRRTRRPNAALCSNRTSVVVVRGTCNGSAGPPAARAGEGVRRTPALVSRRTPALVVGTRCHLLLFIVV